MTHTRTSRRTGAFALALAVAASALLTSVTTPALADEEEPDWRSFVDVAPDYLVDTYDLPEDHVFETVTFERFEWLLNGVYEDATPVAGTFAFLVGGAYDESITSTIGHIDEVAKTYGVETIYTFDPALDGDEINIFGIEDGILHPEGRQQFEELGDRVLGYLNHSPDPEFDGTSSDPYLFIYDRSGADRIVASLNDRKTDADLGTPAAVDAYKAQVATVLAAVDDDGVADLDAIDEWTFTKNETNRRHRQDNPNPVTHGSTIIEDEDGDEGWRLEALTYPELLHLVEQEGDYAILFGGTWCPNSRAVVKQINQQAQEHGVEKVYVFDNSLDSTGRGNYKHIRDNPSPADDTGLPRRPSYLYGDVWNTYFPNVVTQYRISNDEDWEGSVLPVEFHPGGDRSQPVQHARRGQVPFLFHYNKDNVAATGGPAPVVSQWIRTNGPGTSPETGWTEYMTQWQFTPASGLTTGNANQRAFGAAAEDALRTFFGGLPGAYEITEVEVTAQSVGGGAVRLTATVFWCAAIAQDADGTAEFFAVEDDGNVSLGSTTTFEAGQASVTVSDWGLGLRRYYAVYTPSAGSEHRVATSPIEVFSLQPVQTTLEVSGSTAPGTATLSATVIHDGQVAPSAAGTVEFFRPGDPATSFGTAVVADGVASLSLAGLVAGELPFYGVYTPAEGSVYLASTSSTVTVTVPDHEEEPPPPPPPPTPPAFGDIAGSPHAANITRVAGYGIAQGTSPTTFNPSGDVTRAQTATFLARTLRVAGVELPANPQATFPDIAGSPHELAIRQLADLDVIQGTSAGLYAPNAPVSRAQVASLIVRALGHVVDVEGAATSPFTDIAGSPHEANINVIHGLGIAEGRTPTTFNPNGQVTRAQTASFLARTLDLFEREGIVLTPLPRG